MPRFEMQILGPFESEIRLSQAGRCLNRGVQFGVQPASRSDELMCFELTKIKYYGMMLIAGGGSGSM